MSWSELLDSGPGVAVLLSAALLLVFGLPLIAAARFLHSYADSDSDADAPAWWHAPSMAADRSSNSSAAPDAAAGAASSTTGGKLVGGSRGPDLKACQHCGSADASLRCTGCHSATYCSRQCQQKHWQTGHKHECKKIRKQQQSAVKLGAAAAARSGEAVADSAAQANGHAAGAAERKASCSPSSSSKERAEESNSTVPLPKQVLYPSRRFLELAAAPPQRKQPLGLQNVGNSCYANSLLQSLLATPTLAAYLVSGEHGRGCLKPSPSDWCALCELEKLAQQAYRSGASGDLNPRPLLRNVKRLGKQFSFGRQEDSHELYLRLMEAIEAVQLLEAGGKAKYDLRSRETTLIHHVFAGYTRGQIECLSCGHISRTYECCTSLTLEVSARITSLEAALQHFTATERLDGDNRYKCDSCKAHVAADRSTKLEVAPNSLQICLKRFSPGRFGKITSRLAFSEELDLAPYMADGCLDGGASSGSDSMMAAGSSKAAAADSAKATAVGVTPESAAPDESGTAANASDVATESSGGAEAAESPRAQPEAKEVEAAAAPAAAAAGARAPLLYSLYAIVVHIDYGRSTDHGHYIAYVKSGRQWFHCDDATVRPVAASTALAAGAYLLFYQRQQPREIVAAEVAGAATAAAEGSSHRLAAAKAAAAVVISAATACCNGSHHQHPHAPAHGDGAQHSEAAPNSQAGRGSAPPSSDLSAASQQALPEQQVEQWDGAARGDTAQQQACRTCVVVAAEQDSSAGNSSSGTLATSAGPAPGAEGSSCSEAAATAGARGIQHKGSEQQQSKQQQEEEEEHGGDLQAAAAAAAAAAATEVAALRREQEELAAAQRRRRQHEHMRQHGSDDSDAASLSPSGSSSSSSSSSLAGGRFASFANPFELLDPEESSCEDQGEDTVEEGETSGSSKNAAQQQGPASKAAGASPPATSAKQQQKTPHTHAGAKGAGGPMGKAASKAKGSARAPQEQQAVHAAAQQPAGDRRKAAATGAAAPIADAGKPPSGGTTAAEACQQQLPSAVGTCGGSSTQDDEAPIHTPKHRASVSSAKGGTRVLRLSVELPGVQQVGHVDWRLDAAGSSSAQLLLLRAQQYALQLPLPVTVAADACTSHWVSHRQKLTVTWPLLS